MTVEVSGTGKLFGMETLKDGRLAVALRMPRDAIKFYDLKPGMGNPDPHSQPRQKRGIYSPDGDV